MSYQVLNTESLVSYIKKTPSLWNYFDKKEISIQEIGDGNLNFIFLVTSCVNPKQQLIIKQAIPYLRCVGENFSLSKERIHYEIAAFQQYLKHTPQLIPKIFHIDENMCLFAMQYFESHMIMRQGMIKSTVYPKFADHISTFLSENLFKTSSLYLNSYEKSQLIAQFNSNELRQLTEDFVFTFPYMDNPTNKIRPKMRALVENVWRDIEFKQRMLQLKDLFMNKADALLHGDLHTGSILINQEETIVIDPEFAYMGPFGFDLGAILANLIMSWISHMVLNSAKSDYSNWILNLIEELWQRFEQKFLSLWDQRPDTALVNHGFFLAHELSQYKQKFMLNLLQETIGFTGCKIARRQWGVAGVADIRGIQNEEVAIQAETIAISIARHFVVHYRNFKKIQDMIKILRHHTEQNVVV